MPVVGMNISRIEAVKNAPIEGQVGIGQNPNITGVRKTDIPNFGQEGLEVDFDFSCDYKDQGGGDENIAQITFEGSMIYVPDEGGVDEILETWESDEELPQDMFVSVINNIINRCLSRSIGLAEELSIPAPIRFPTVQAQQPDQSKYIG